MSPEQVEDKQLKHQTDIYSLGVVMYHRVNGKRPLQGSTRDRLLYQIVNLEPLTPSLHRPEIPPGLDSIVMRALAKSREARYTEWRELAQELAQLFEHLRVPDQDLSDAEKFSTLRLLPFFSAFGDVEIWETLRISEWHRRPAGANVVREGDAGDGFFILAAGEVFVSRAGVVLDTLMRGHCFGKILYFEEGSTPRTTTILATTNVVLMEIKARALLRASPACQVQYYQSFLRILMKRIERFEQRPWRNPVRRARTRPSTSTFGLRALSRRAGQAPHDRLHACADWRPASPQFHTTARPLAQCRAARCRENAPAACSGNARRPVRRSPVWAIRARFRGR